MRGRWLAGLAATLPLGLLLPPVPRPAPHAPSPAVLEDRTCRICHPGPTQGLRDGPHGYLLAPTAQQDACAVCHGDLAAHAKAAIEQPGEPGPAVPRVAAASCAACHAGKNWAPSLAAHAWSAPRDPLPQEIQQPPPEAPQFDWNALITFGYRFVDVTGSEARYETDIDLDEGWTVLEGEAAVRGRDGAPFQLAEVTGSDFGGPHHRLRGRFETSWLEATADHQKDRWRYRATGPYSRVDRHVEDAGIALELELTDELRLFTSYRHREDDGYWLTQRLGSRNVTPVVVINGVQSPRTYESDFAELGFGGQFADFDWTLSADYRDDAETNRWTYAQPSTIDPNFLDSEDFVAASTLRGPGGRATLSRRFERLSLSANARFVDLDRRTTGDGVQTGFDISDFTTTTDSDSAGSAQTWLVDATATWEASDRLALILDGRWFDHDEEMAIYQTEVTQYPTLGTSTTVITNLTQRTSQSVLDGSLSADCRVLENLDVTVGYGWSREELSLPDLETGDNAFVSGTIRTDGWIAGARWKPHQDWKLDFEWRGYGMGSTQLHEISEDDAQRWRARLRWQRDALALETFYGEQRVRNHAVPHQDDRTTLGVNGSWAPREDLWLSASYVFTDARTRTLTNFYFDPDPTPVPTIVGFDGETNSVVAGFGMKPSADVTWRLDSVWTSTRGSFDVTLWDLVADVSVRVWDGGEAGLQWRGTDYEEGGGADDYHSDLVTVYFRQRLGPAQR